MNGGKAVLAAQRATAVQDKTIINQIMLRFRPIAPKPVTDGSISGDLAPSHKKELVTNKRAKRKYVRVNKNRGCMKNKAEEPKKMFDRRVVTLQLLPEITIRNNSPAGGNDLDFPVKKPVHPPPSWMNSDRMAAVCPMRVVESRVTVECVTDAGEGRGRLGCTDDQKMKNLETDTCPGFISDGVDVVRWVNLSYRRMVVDSGEGAAPEVVVRLVAKERFPAGCAAFSCRVRVSTEKQSWTVPCDAWRMDLGGFAWRLDVEAALSLGR